MMLRVKHIRRRRRAACTKEVTSGLSYVRHHSSLAALIVLAAATRSRFALLTFLPISRRRCFMKAPTPTAT